METLVWHKVDDKLATVLALTDDTLYRFGFSGGKAKKQATAAVSALLGGESPAGLDTKGVNVKAVPVSSIRREEVSHGGDTVTFFASGGAKPEKVDFGGKESPEIAQIVAGRAGITEPERQEEVGAFEAILPPLIVGVIAGVFWMLIFGAASTIANGEEIDPNTGGRRGRALKALVVGLAQTLGYNGTVAVGVVLAVAVVGWTVSRIVNRPQRTAWGAPRA
jgi:hypothetical protein